MEHTGSGFLASLDHEQRARYYQWWRKYLLLKRITWVAGAVYLGCWIMALAEAPLSSVAKGLLMPVLFAFFGSGIWGSLLDCPRCGETFRGWAMQKYFGDECQNCGLSGSQLSAIARPKD